MFSTDGKILLCNICEPSVNYERKYFISQHVNTTKHKNALSKPIGKKISLLPTVIAMSSRKSQFALDLFTAFVNAGIPLWKLENPTLRQFFEKYTNEPVTSESSLRKCYLSDCCDRAMKTIIKNQN